MSVRWGILALLTQQPMYGAQLRSEFEERTGGTWPLNVGQVYTTLGRLERDGLVACQEADDEGRISYQITREGRRQVKLWWESPVPRDETPRSELVIKLALAVTVPAVNVPLVVQNQRSASFSHLQDLTRLKRGTPTSPAGKDSDSDLAWSLVLDHLIFTAEAELRWLDHVEGRLQREAARGIRPVAAIDTASADEHHTERAGR
ncbi:MAG: PadR family transcriptional regulator [Microlunatus sp.]|nr:PadR family transcriptional regulator [Microlunatus sp.]